MRTIDTRPIGAGGDEAMISMGRRDEIAGATWFARTGHPYLLVDRDHTMVAANAAYEAVTGHPWPALAGEKVFDVFPDNPDEPGVNAVASLSASLERVLSVGRRDWMGVQRYDVPDRHHAGRFVRKVWVPVNSPVLEGGRTVAVLHHVEDVTAVAAPGPTGVTPAVEDEARRLGRRFPGLPFNAVLGVLVHSCLVAAQIHGAPDMHTARRLAVLRLEVLAGHPAEAVED
ncbi:MAG TPA: PAS domain-containing protein [Acidimicrobiales bacterium]|nr:PAS domain-containing protein [Acidimicrobiales bacterium]